MKLTKEEAIRRHRMLWNWIADETEKQNRCVEKVEAFEHFGWGYAPFHCWCCAYDAQLHGACDCCPVIWPPTDEEDEGNNNIRCGASIFWLWCESLRFNDVPNATKWAREIANLPERPGV